MNSARILTATALVLAAGVAGCGSKTPHHAAAELAPIAAQVTPVERISEGRPIEVYGIVQPARQSFISSRVVGPVIAVKVEAGDTVRAGQAMVEIQPAAADGQVAQAMGARAQAEAALALAEKNYRRFQSLHDQKAASDLELDMARMQYEQAKGAVTQAGGAVQAASSVAAEAVVRAPFAARVVDKMVEVGDLAAPGRPLVHLESLSGRKIWLTVRSADIRRLEKGQELEVRIDARPDLGTLTGTVDEIVPAADPASHTFTVKVSLAGVTVSSGVSGRAVLPGDVVERLAIPAAALFRRGGLELVVVRDDDGTARTRAVTTGRTLSGDRIEVLSGLGEGERVVLGAPGPVADGTPVEVAP